MIYVPQLCTAASKPSNAARKEEFLLALLDMKVSYEDCFHNSRRTLTYKRKCQVQGLSEAHPLEQD